VGPVTKPLHMLGLGMSVGTPPAGITAQVVFIPSFAALDAMTPGAKFEGEDRGVQPGMAGYGVITQLPDLWAVAGRGEGAIAVLVRSVRVAMQFHIRARWCIDAKQAEDSCSGDLGRGCADDRAACARKGRCRHTSDGAQYGDRCAGRECDRRDRWQ